MTLLDKSSVEVLRAMARGLVEQVKTAINGNDEFQGIVITMIPTLSAVPFSVKNTANVKPK
jgi:hypothetical protein